MVAILRTVGRVVVWVAGGVLGASFLAGYVSAFLAPEWFWWTEPFAVLLPITSTAGVAAAAVWWMMRRSSAVRGAVLGGMVVLAVLRFYPLLGGGGQGGVPPGSAAAAPGDSAGVLRVMSFNVPVTGRSEQRLTESVTNAVRTEAPDVLALQEPSVQTVPSKQEIWRSTPQIEGLLQADDYHLPRVLPTGVKVPQIVLARTVIDSLTQYRLASSKHPFASRVAFEWQGRELVLYNVHLHTTVGKQKPWRSSRFRIFDLAFWAPVLETYRTGALRRAEQARRLRRMIENETAPVIVAGDFNSTPHHWVYRHIAGADGLRDAHRLGGTGFGWTYPSDRPLVRIDYLLIDDAWEVVSTRVSPSYATSDHRPVITHLRWNPN